MTVGGTHGAHLTEEIQLLFSESCFPITFLSQLYNYLPSHYPGKTSGIQCNHITLGQIASLVKSLI